MKTILLLTIGLILSNYLSAQSTWSLSNAGIESGFKVTDFAVTKSNSIYAIGTKNISRIYQSLDNGNSWTLKDTIKLPGYGESKNIICAFGDTLLLCTDGGEYHDLLYKSIDNCKSWSVMNPNLSPLYIADFIATQENQVYEVGRVYRCCPTFIYPAIFKFSDTKSDASLLKTDGLGWYNDNFWYNSICEVGNTFLLSVNDRNQNSFVYKSIDNGITWNIVYSGIENGYIIKKFARTKNNTVFALVANSKTSIALKIIQSKDSGQNWNEVKITGLDNHNFTYNDICASENTLLISAENSQKEYAIYRSDDITPSRNLKISDNIKIYPNPNDGDFSLDYANPGNKTLQIKIADLTGKMVFETINTREIFNYDGQKLQSGIYVITVIGEHRLITNKMIVK